MVSLEGGAVAVEMAAAACWSCQLGRQPSASTTLPINHLLACLVSRAAEASGGPGAAVAAPAAAPAAKCEKKLQRLFLDMEAELR